MNIDDLFNLSDEELSLVNAKRGSKNKLGFAILLKYFQLEGRYPKHVKFIDPFMLNSVAHQLNIPASCVDHFDWEGRSTERFRNEIRKLFGYKLATLQDIDKLKIWLIREVFPNAVKQPQQIEYAYVYFREQRIEPFTSKELERHIQSAHYAFEQQLFETLQSQLSDRTKKLMDLLLTDDLENEDSDDHEEEIKNLSEIKFRHLKRDIPGAKLKHVAFAIQKINCLKQLELPEEFLLSSSTKLINKYYTRVMAELPGSMREHKALIRYATFSIFCYFRSQILTDSLADLLMQLIHKMQNTSEKFIDNKILSEVKRVGGKFDILYQLSFIALSNPTGIIQETIYPEIGQETLSNLVKELKYKGQWYKNQVHKKMHSIYSHAHRNTLLTLLDAFTFKTNIHESKLLLEAIQIIQSHRDISDHYYPVDILVPIEKVIPHEWLSLVVELKEVRNNVNNQMQKIKRINRVHYELAVLQELRRQLNCKTIWIDGAYRYRNPSKDLPKDFEENREYYYNLLGLPLNVHEFIDPRKKELHQNLKTLNDSILTNKKVKITEKNGGHIKISPSEAQVEPPNIKQLQKTIKKEWPIINLIDILKETELQIEFTDVLHTAASRENLSKEVLRLRLLLCLYAIGTNTGLKPISAANNSATHSHLRYVKRKFITVEGVRQAIIKIIDSILKIRDSRIWGEATTGVACDSKKLSVWDQNLMAEWHTRYQGRGVMVYWHVEKKAVCIYSQLKTCSSSEVGSMIKGILQHCTTMEVNEAYVDTHGQSLLAFGVSDLLKFDLLPRFKNIHKQKLYYPSSSDKNKYEHLQLILEAPIHWKLIEDNYDEVIKNVAAIKTGAMEPDVFVKRFSKDNYQHPVYRALLEIGKIEKTNFLCRCLMSEELRIEIHEAQNVVERLNSIMGFIFYGKLGEISTNIKEEQELGIVCLHLLQACMSYINTLIFQEVLTRPEWKDKLTPEDKRALNVLFHSHINPYGLFLLDLEKRLPISANDIETNDENQIREAIEKLVEEELI